MYRDDSDAIRHQLETTNKEAETLRSENDAMRQQLLAMRRGDIQVAPAANVYAGNLAQLSPGERVALSQNQVEAFPVWATGILHVITLGLFSLIHFGRIHGQLPRATDNDPSAAKSIGFTFIPYFNFYWVFFNSMRLAERLNLQLRLRNEEPDAPWSMMIACSVLTVIPYINLLIGIPILWTIGVCLLQHSVNKVAALGPAALPAGAPVGPALPDYSRPPAGLIGPGSQ